MIDRSLNYGREIIKDFAIQARNYKTVLDIGAGNGVDLLSYRSIENKCDLFALEAYKPNIEILNKNKIKTYDIDLEKDIFPFADNSIDIINANQILEHTKEFFWIMHETTRTLRLGGKFILGVPNLASFHNRLLLLLGKQPSCIQVDSAHIRGFTKNGIASAINNIWGGYKMVAFRGSNFYPFSPILAKPLSRIFPNGAVTIFIMFEKVDEYKNSDFLHYPIDKKLETNYYLGR